MTWFEAVILALVGGLGEILPISGTAHLKIFEKLLGLRAADPNLHLYRAMLYAGTALSLLWFYRRRILRMLRELLGIGGTGSRRRSDPMDRRLLGMLLPAELPLLLLLFLRKTVYALDQSVNALLAVGGLLCVTGLILFFADRGFRKKKQLAEMTLPNALLIGLSQALSVFPGLSRAGLTVGTSLRMGFDRSFAIEFSGLLAIPVMIAAAIYELTTASSLGTVQLPIWICLLGLVLSFCAAQLALSLWTSASKRHRATGFAYWCWGAGLFALALFLIS